MKKVLSRLKRIAFLNKRNRKYVRLIKKSGIFDCNHYCAQLKKRSSQRLFPIRHYVTEGEALGLSPAKEFYPDIYRENNWDIDEYQIPLFKHYILHGKMEGRNATKLLLDMSQCLKDKVQSDTSLLSFPKITPNTSKEKNVVVLHIYYPHLWPEFKSNLEAITEKFDLICTITDKAETSFKELSADIKSFKPNAKIYLFPNHGRDIYPFIHLINTGQLDSYQVICKLHTKVSPHRPDGEKWRQQLIQGILPDKKNPSLFLDFYNYDEIGLLVADDNLSVLKNSLWGSNMAKTYRLLKRTINLEINTNNLIFPMGSIFMTKQPLIKKLKSLKLTANDFELEDGQIDGTTAHCIERAVGYLVHANGDFICERSQFITKEF